MGEPRWFYRDDKEWKGIFEKLKLTPCPHCQVMGTLIRHGGLQGFDENRRIVLRARRVFCSNRNARLGCGRTISVWLANTIKRLKPATRRLWTFLQKAVADTLDAATRTLDSPLSDRTWQRIWTRFKKAQSQIRTALMNRWAPPKSLAPACGPEAEVLAHLQAAFPQADCPIAAFQHSLQTFLM